MKLGLQINKFTSADDPGGIAPLFAERVRWAEAAGFASVFVMDHLFQIPNNGPAEEAMLEAYTALSYAAALTERVRLGTMVVGVTYRNPGFLVKQATSLDVLAGGRTYFGVGAAWFEREHLGLGIPFPPLKERFERLEETLQIALQMWSDDNGPYEGAHYQLAETIGEPKPVSQPHPRIMIGGSGERKTLRLVAQYADACNIGAGNGIETVEHKLAVLREHCDRLGRDFDAIEKTSIGGFRLLSRSGAEGTMSPQEAVEFLGQLADAGIEQALIGIGAFATDEARDILANDLMPVLAGLQAARR